VCIEDSEKDETKEQHFMEAHIVQNDAREENVVVKE